MGRAPEMFTTELRGWVAEIEYNQRLSNWLASAFQGYAQKYGLGTNIHKPSPIPVQRFRLNATEVYLQRPVAVEGVLLGDVELYWDRASFCNEAMNKTTGRLTTVGMLDDVVEKVMQAIPQMNNIAVVLAAKIRGVIESLNDNDAKAP